MKLHRFIISIVLVFVGMQSCKFTTNNNRGYEGDLIPLKNEVANIGNYKRAVRWLMDNEYYAYPDAIYNDKFQVQNYLRDSLNLRFSVIYSIKPEKGDTLIHFRASPTDYYMRSNGDWSTYTLFEHSIFYTNKEVETGKSEKIDIENGVTPYATYHLGGNYYYEITSHIEY